MKRYEFTNELSKEAMDIYSDSSFTFYKKNDVFYVADNPKSEPWELGTLEEVEEFLLQFTEC